ncbi:MAG: ferritin, partial [Polaribacter sp.]
MLLPIIEKALNEQITVEAESSQVYLAMASWAEVLGFEGVAEFMYAHSDEERMHMLKLVKFINERGGHAKISKLQAPPSEFGSFKQMFQELFNHEVKVSEHINNLVDICLQEKDYATHNFLQWYVSEQI